MAQIAVLGGGGTGCYIAADLKLRGYSVNLYEEKKYWHENIDAIQARGGIELTGSGATGFARLDKITDNLAEAVEDVELIIVSMVAWRHEKLAKDLKPLVTDDTVIILSAGNFGSIRFKRIFGEQSKAVVGETMGNMFSCRMLGNGVGIAAGPYRAKMAAAFPARDNGKLIERYSKFYPCVEAKNVFETALNAPNIVIHLAGSLLNTCGVERNPEFALYRDGLSEGVINCQKAVEAEKAKIMDVMGYKMVIHTDHMERLIQYDKFPELDCFRSLAGPSSTQHRYVREDATTGDSILVCLGERIGAPALTLTALIRVAGAVNREDYFKQGLTLADLGITGRTPEEINTYLYTGEKDYEYTQKGGQQ
ncbi:MAG: NAD/NADP octopine/nopaline dehydrogenase family protein [Eubacteriales bacterium]|nr:NAD/NADP octopine/nopaline dehydrogenase family protein [Eubacteriales bacterium]